MLTVQPQGGRPSPLSLARSVVQATQGFVDGPSNGLAWRLNWESLLTALDRYNTYMEKNNG